MSSLPRALVPLAAVTSLAGVLLIGSLAAPVRAHTELASVVPADGAAVEDPPTEVVLEFTRPLADPEAARVEVIDPVGDDLVAAPPVVDGATVTVPLNLAVAEGAHEVRWTVIADDGHRVEGTSTFTFAPPAAIATPPDADPPADAGAGSPTAGAGPVGRPTTGGAADEAPGPTPAATADGTAEGEAEVSPTFPATELADPTATEGGAAPTRAFADVSPTFMTVLGIVVLAAVGAVLFVRIRGREDLEG